MKIRNAKR